MSTAKWYVVHTYSGYENKVKANIDKTIENKTPGRPDSGSQGSDAGRSGAQNGVQKAAQRKLFLLCTDSYDYE
mgnify:CR=1 FL=1